MVKVYEPEFKKQIAQLHLQADISKFAHLWYNHNRPHSYNGYKTPFEKR